MVDILNHAASVMLTYNTRSSCHPSLLPFVLSVWSSCY